MGGVLSAVMTKLNHYLRGWRGYYDYTEAPWTLQTLDKWVRRRLRSLIWFRWKTSKNRLKNLTRRGVKAKLARRTAGSSKGPWRLAASQGVQIALDNAYFDHVLKLIRLAARRALN